MKKINREPYGCILDTGIQYIVYVLILMSLVFQYIAVLVQMQIELVVSLQWDISYCVNKSGHLDLNTAKKKKKVK